MKKFWENYAEVIVLVGYAILIAASFKFAIVPLNSSIEEKKRGAEKLSIDQEISKTKSSEISALKSKIDLARSTADKMNVFVMDANALSLIENIEALAEETGCDIKIEVVGETNENPKAKDKKVQDNAKDSLIGSLPEKHYITMDISISGRFNSIIKFVEKMEDFRYFSDIIAINFAVKEIKNEQNIFTVNRETLNFVEGEKTETENSLENSSELVVEVEKISTESNLEGNIKVVFYFEK